MSYNHHNRKRLLKGASWSEHEPLPHIYRPSRSSSEEVKKSAFRYKSLYLFLILFLLSFLGLNYLKAYKTEIIVLEKKESFSQEPKPKSKSLETKAASIKSKAELGAENLKRASLSPAAKVSNNKVSNSKVSNIVHSVRSGESLHSIFSKHGFSYSAATEVDTLLRESKEVSHLLKPGQKLDFSKNSEGEFKLLNISLSPVKSVKISKTKTTSPLKLSLNEKVVSQVETAASGQIITTFADAALDNKITYNLVDDFVDIFASKIRFDKDLRSGDSFSIIFDKNVLDDGTEVGGDKILAAGINIQGQTFHALYVKDKDGSEHLVDRNGEIIGNTFLRYPLKFSRISSHFSHSRLHPILKRRKPHMGVDFAAPTGTPIRSVADGRVTFAGRKGPNGVMLKIQHGSRYKTAYLHLSKIEKGIKNGSIVERGQVIGRVGSTGRSTGPHLDYRFYLNGKSVNPLKVELPKIDYEKKLNYDKALHARRVQELDNQLKVQSALKSKNKKIAFSQKQKKSKKS